MALGALPFPHSGLYKAFRGDVVRLDVWDRNAGVILLAVVRGVYNDGERFEIEVSGTTAGSIAANSTRKAQRDGWYTQVDVGILVGTSQRARIFAAVFPLGGGRLRGPLTQGYVYDGFHLGLGYNIEPGSGRGFYRTITGSNPAAGAEASDAVPTRAIWRLLSYSIVLVADATGANRVPRLVADDGAATARYWLLENGAGNPVTASETRTQLWQQGPDGVVARKEATDTQIVNVISGLPDQALIEGDRIRTITDAIVAGDDYAAPIFIVEEWVVPA